MLDDADSLLTLLHVLLFCYWLGGDIGVFYASGFVVDSKYSRDQRLIAAKIMLAIDLVPRVCMSLMLTVGGLLAELRGITHPWWQMLGILLLGPVWLGGVLLLHFRHDAPYHDKLAGWDRLLRWMVIVGILLSTIDSLWTGEATKAPWLTLKLLGFATLVFCGLMIRASFNGFANGYVALLKGEPTREQNDVMARSLSRVRPWVVLIWVILIGEAWLGIAQPYFGITS